MNDISLKKNTMLNILKMCSTILFPLIVGPYVRGVLLPDNMGKIGVAQSYISYFTLIAGLGLGVHAIRECATVKGDREKLTRVSSELFSINIITTIVSYFFLILMLLFFKNLSSYKELILIESVTIIAITIGADWFNSAMEDYVYITVRTVTFQGIALILIFLFVRDQDDLYKYAIISVFSTVATNITNVWYRRKYCNVKFTLDIDWKKHIAPITFLFVMQLSVTIFNSTDMIMLGSIVDDHEAGLYDSAHKITRLTSQVVQSLGLVVIPRLTIYFERGDFTSANKLLRKILGFNLVLGLPCVAGVIMMANEIILLFGGGIEYINAVPVIRVLILSFMFSLVGGSFLGNAILIPMKNEKYYMIVCCITAIANIILNVLLIPIFGAVGAAIATAFNGFLVMVLLIWKVDKRIHVAKMKTLFLHPIVGCVSIVLCCLLCSKISNLYLRTIGSIMLSAFIYGLVEIILGNDMIVEMLNTISTKVMKRKIMEDGRD